MLIDVTDDPDLRNALQLVTNRGYTINLFQQFVRLICRLFIRSRFLFAHIFNLVLKKKYTSISRRQNVLGDIRSFFRKYLAFYFLQVDKGVGCWTTSFLHGQNARRFVIILVDGLLTEEKKFLLFKKSEKLLLCFRCLLFFIIFVWSSYFFEFNTRSLIPFYALIRSLSVLFINNTC